jgi:hypothetical protein
MPAKSGPPPGWTPTLAATKPILAAAAAQFNVFVGKIPPTLSNETLLNCLKECGKVAKWTRHRDAAHQLRTFGYCTFEHGFAGVRCVRVLSSVNIHSTNLMVRIGSKEQVALEAIAQVECSII